MFLAVNKKKEGEAGRYVRVQRTCTVGTIEVIDLSCTFFESHIHVA